MPGEWGNTRGKETCSLVVLSDWPRRCCGAVCSTGPHCCDPNYLVPAQFVECDTLRREQLDDRMARLQELVAAAETALADHELSEVSSPSSAGANGVSFRLQHLSPHHVSVLSSVPLHTPAT